MRLPGSVAEAQASPPGPEIGAFFDLDGTLVAGFTGVLLTQDAFRRREIGIGEVLGVVQSALNHQLGRADEPDGPAQSITEPKARTGRLLGDHFRTTRYAR
jgi:putative phosphoserine phosphatase/1-acylglycerol-3-phosphate O-acyltransferase